jgi:hypothetical protein
MTPTSTRTSEAGEEIEASLSALVDTALEPFDAAPADRALVRAMIDLGTWQALRDQGLAPAEAVDAVSQMLAARVHLDRRGR